MSFVSILLSQTEPNVESCLLYACGVLSFVSQTECEEVYIIVS